ncbi:hypothetical protein QFW77_03585 [Luteimonas sp. RD2P54]|uniref:Uncharacterized protein n=1 Tax=Luteimonas endophytica TaxID=3042023 RepID=A0ABT6J5G5_9GAMM|nr:hypothetical protein [Luteimonas endophytica]MDH5822076.1 hypothetical protein [Luteimonas endophytica]
MAFFIPIQLIEHTPDAVTYEYSQPIRVADPAKPRRFVEVGHNVGRVTLCKSTSTVTQISGSDWDAKGVIFQRVAAKVIKHHLNGLYPENTAYEA